jgi:hypothetical protein
MSEKYIVVFTADTEQDIIDKTAKDVESAGGTVGHRYGFGGFKGFAASIPDKMLETLKAHEKIESIEIDGEVRIC